MAQSAPTLYSTIIRVAGILSVLAMAIFDEMNGFHNNEIFYAGTIGALVIGPHALDRLGDHEQGSTAAVTRVASYLIPAVGIAVSAARIVSILIL